MTASAEIAVNGERFVALSAGALYWPARETLIVADLHFEKGSHFAAKGVMLPPYDTRATLLRLAALLDEHKPKQLISLGDAFHDGEAQTRMNDEDAAMLQSIAAATRMIWILGNHDPAPPARFAGAVEQSVRLGRLLFRHEPAPFAEAGEVAGHLHPAARVRVETRLVRRRCFASDGERLIMPAFGAYAGGLNILDDAFRVLFRREMTAYLLGGRGIYPFRAAALVGDPGTAARLAG